MALNSFGWFKYLIPSFSFKLSGFELSFNYKLHNAKGSTYVYFLIELFDINLLRFSSSSEKMAAKNVELLSEKSRSQEPFTTSTETFAFLGFTRVVRLYKHEGNSTRWNLDTRLVNILLLLLGIWLLKSYFIITSGYLTLIMPALCSPILQLSFLEVLISLRAFVALFQAQLAISNIVRYFLVSQAFDTTPSELIMPFFHYRITLFFLITPALMFSFHPVAFVMLSSAIISTLDVLFSYKSMLHFSWLGSIHINLLRCKLKDMTFLTKAHLVNLQVLSCSFKRGKFVNNIERISDKINPKTDFSIYDSHGL